MIFDTHAHYDDEAFQEDRDSLLMSLKDNDIGAVINVAADMESVETTLALSQKYSFVYAALGVHPSGTAALTEEDMQHILTLATEHSVKRGGKVVVIMKGMGIRNVPFKRNGLSASSFWQKKPPFLLSSIPEMLPEILMIS